MEFLPLSSSICFSQPIKETWTNICLYLHAKPKWLFNVIITRTHWEPHDCLRQWFLKTILFLQFQIVFHDSSHNIQTFSSLINNLMVTLSWTCFTPLHTIGIITFLSGNNNSTLPWQSEWITLSFLIYWKMGKARTRTKLTFQSL